ncbi:putative tail protein [Aeromonas phage Aer_P220]|uniref:Tail protein n=1 Tax=Aeromonas phage Aer_P220 TaxID=2951227 RepID=A0A9E7NND2_9CAUD|nr:putative tail protein [Aeromonas phage Aer_P220]
MSLSKFTRVSGSSAAYKTHQLRVPSEFASLQMAFDSACTRRSQNGERVVILIESGYQPTSGILCSNGDFSQVFIESESPLVTLSPLHPTTVDFIHGENCAAPVLACLVDANARCNNGYLVQNRASGYVLPNCGVINAGGSGLVARYGSFVKADGTKWTGAAQGGGQTSGILSWAAGISAELADTSGSVHYGAQSAHGGWLSFRGGNADNCQRYGIRATDSGFIDADGASAENCGLNGIRAFNLGIINFRDGKARNCGGNTDAASGAISASYGSTVNAVAANLSSSKYQAVIALNSTVTLTQANMSGAYRFGINAQGASNISAGSSDVSGAGSSGVQALGSTVHCPSINANNCAAYGISALEGSNVNASGAQAVGCGTGGITARDGSTVNAKGSDTSGTLAGNCLFAWSGKIVATNAIAQAGASPATTDIRVFEGGEIVANSGTVGGTSVTVNTITAAGIIYK